MKQELGRRAHWGFKSEVKKLLKKSNRAEEKMFSEDDRKQAIVSYLLRGEWSIADEDLIIFAFMSEKRSQLSEALST